MEILKGFEVINLKQPKGESVMTVTSNSLKFNKATAVELNYAPYIRVLLNAKTRQIAIQPCSEKDPNKDRIGKSYNDYIAGHQMNLFEDFIGYQGSVVLDEPEQKTDTISVLIPQCEESENIPLSDFPEQPENVQRPGSEVVEKGMLT